MAGDWIKMRNDLHDDPAVITISEACGLDEYAVVGRLHKLWSWADRHSLNGNDVSVTEEWVDRYTECEHFGYGMVMAGWLENKDGHVIFPRFDRHNGESAKKRALTNKRVADFREMKRTSTATGNGECSAKSNTVCVTESVTREEKRRVKPPLSPTPEFAAFWEAWPKSERKGAKGECLAKWEKLKLNGQAEAVIAHVEMMKASRAWTDKNGQFIPAPLVYLNGKSWDGAEKPERIEAPQHDPRRLVV